MYSSDEQHSDRDAGTAECPSCACVGPQLPESFYARDALDVARDLVGKEICRAEVRLRITEVEAYRFPGDTANHARAGRTARNAPMWGPPGRAYVYFCYGMHWLLNLVTNPEGQAAAVLVRSAEPLAGLEVVRARRGGKQGPVLLTGPGKVAAALGLDGSFNHHPVFEAGDLEVREGSAPARLVAGPRVGIDYASARDRKARWRLADAESRWVTRRSQLTPLRRT